ncbi:hypothetical protein AYO40_03410 [Planctomycetaceae bacterium SCGC AG-212-D15]|nr:hypothetical protein AYO40_03410 [Planctomycetaceae bacterium SCGC AG-212-D15]
MATFTQDNKALRFRCSAGGDALLLNRFTGSEAISELFRFELELLAEQEVDFDAVLGKPASIEIDLPGGSQRFVHGIVSRLTQGRRVWVRGGKVALIRYQAELAPKLWFLTRRVRCRIIQDASLSEILDQLFTEWRIDYRPNLSRLYQKRPYWVQYNESDYQFFRRITAEDGLSFFFQHDKAGHRLVVTDAQSGFAELDPGTIVYDDTEVGRVNEPRIRDWRKVQEVRANQAVLRDYCFEMPTNELVGRAAVPAAAPLSLGRTKHGLNHPLLDAQNADLLVHLHYPGGYGQRHDAVGADGSPQLHQEELTKIEADKDWLARVRLEEDQATGLTVAGESDCAHFLPGFRFTLDRHYDSNVPANDDDAFLLTAVEHSADIGGVYDSDNPGTAVYSNRFRGMPFALTYRPARTPKPRIEGPQTAVVVGSKGAEIFLDLYGRIRVHFRWQDRADSATSCWVRVAQFWAGKNWGAQFFPRVGHEVVVAFEDGDPDRPLVIGSVYNEVNRPALDLPDSTMLSGIKSCTFGGAATANFNAIIFHDTPSNEHVQIHSENNDVQNSETNQFRYVNGARFDFHGSF